MPAAGYELQTLRVEGISRSNPLKAARAVFRAGAAIRTARRIVDGADAVLGGGGYVAGPVGLAALTKRIPVVLTEADSHLGLTNRLLAPRARRVCLAFPIHGRDGDRYLVTGRPVPPTVDDRAAARAEFGIPPEATCVLVFGGSLGARSINLAAVEAFADAGFHVLHVPGARDFAELHGSRRALPPARIRDPVRAGARRRRPRRRPRRRLGVRARPVRPAGDPDPVSARVRRPPDRQRALDGGGRRRDDPPGRRAHARSGSGPRSTPCSATPSGWPGWPPRRAAWRARTPPRWSPERCSPPPLDLLRLRGVRCKPHSTLSNRNQSPSS